MKLLVQVLVLAFCAYTATSSNTEETEVQKLINSIDGIAQSIANAIGNIFHGGNSHSPSQSTNPTAPSAADPCYSTYITQLQSIEDQIQSQSQNCYSVSQQNLETFYSYYEFTYNVIAALSADLQKDLSACGSAADALGTFNCFTATYNTNLKLLNTLAVQSELTATYLKGFAADANIVRNGCIDSVIVGSKVNGTIAANTLENCLVSAEVSTSSGSN